MNNLDAWGSLGIDILELSNSMLLTALLGDGNDKNYSENSLMVLTLKKSTILADIISQCKNEFYLTGNDSFFEKSNFYSYNSQYDFDLSLSVGAFLYNISFEKETKTTGILFWKKQKTRVVTTVKVSDTYDFDSFRQGFSMSNVLNNIGVAFQNVGVIKPFYWEAEYKIYDKWK